MTRAERERVEGALESIDEMARTVGELAGAVPALKRSLNVARGDLESARDEAWALLHDGREQR